MAQIRIRGESAPGTPPAGFIYIYPKTDGLVYAKDDSGNEYLLSGLIRDTALGSAPSQVQFKVLNGGAGVADILYVSMQKKDNSWAWVPLKEAP
jgi:hypothetical protein